MGLRWIMAVIATMLLSCDLVNVADPEAEITALPEVVSTGINYTSAELLQSLPDTALLGTFAKSYARRYSPKLKQALVEHILAKAQELHMNERQLREGFDVTGQLADSVIALPYRVEFARFESQHAWTIEFAYSPDTTYADYRCFVVSASRMDTLLTLCSR